MRAIPIIAGPTAGGKTELALTLASRLPGAEIISADAFQVYRGMDIGTGKAPPAERASIPHHLIDIVEPTEPFTASDWLARARATIAAIRSRAGSPIVVGGTHLYIKMLLDGMFKGPAADPSFRAELEGMDSPALRAELERVDPSAAGRIHPNDRRRTIRALEVHRLTGRTISEQQRQWDSGDLDPAWGDDIPALMILNWSSEGINRRINARVRAMVEAGLEAEVRGLLEGGRLGPQACEALGYKQFAEHLAGRLGREQAIERIKIETRRFAKSQRTWLRRLGTVSNAISLCRERLTNDECMAEMLAHIAKLG